MTLKQIFILATGAVCFWVNANVAVEARSFPDKPIKIVVPAAAGSPNDFPARLAKQILEPRLGQPVIIETRPGAGGAIAAREAAKAPPDGYTLLMGNTSTLAVIPAVFTDPGYDPVKNFAPIAKITEGFQILVVHPSSPWRSVKQLVDYAKANPGKLNYAHTGTGGLPNLAGELFMLRSGVQMTGVSYRSGGESATAVLSRAVDLTFENVAILVSQIRAGTLRGLAAQNSTRTKLLPDLPTMAEAGISNAEANTFFGLVAPAGTPADVIKTLNEALNEGMRSSEFQRLIVNVGSESKPNSPEEFAAYIAIQHRKWLEVGKTAGVHLN